ncbi:SDR family oxidoreductase [Amycolatopsis rubida]|uniref:NAD(P)-dependent dehydrogenase, short-chain alcohol dehydrogenase family n=1 Tax=Amycolatopsis rubida TaxID=112413 RepID=A0A1I5ZFM0_9PSEU|nr:MULTISPECIES: SDR family oxidoreductase [Amycolatopsis]MYW92971.1 SDR family oxidoreductase [Amycolatopsis rubida]NEC57958.1 SDR family oxidoreductase [Amycolatopsis rubida]OAP25496.1 4-formylbenzenesulfonate dehydrogenase TsaC1/TsaC2 [Amycolatopsis sp. M39]SFQ55256.1 NAD(P)-dependent dehydrogenase, short-chain alcohol dehydrogenase family [Amycolatopsis rubida]
MKPETQDARRAAGHAVLVTGAAGGIGHAVAVRLAADGWTVLAADLDQVGATPEAAQFPDRVHPMVLDVSDGAAVDLAAARLRSTGPELAGLVNVAGVLQDVEPLVAQNAQTARRVWEVNYFGAQRCTQAFAPLLIDAGGGAIVNITSINAHRPLPLHAYAPAKAALAAATVLAAGDLGRYGIRVNGVAPGFTTTPAMRRKLALGTRDAAGLVAHTALARLVEPSEVAAAVSFLLGDDAAAITGVSLPVDAGWTATAHWMDFGNRLDPAKEKQ